MPSALADGVHIAQTFARAGMLKPSRPDRTARALLGLHRFGPTLAAGYLGAAARYPDAVAVIDELGPITFAEIDRAGNAVARGLAGYGVRPGDSVAVLCRNHRWFIVASIACSRLGAHALYLNTSFAGPQVTDVCDREGATAIVHDAEFEPVIAAAAAGRAAFLAYAEPAPPQPQDRAGHPAPPPSATAGPFAVATLAELVAGDRESRCPRPTRPAAP